MPLIAHGPPPLPTGGADLLEVSRSVPDVPEEKHLLSHFYLLLLQG